MIKVHRQDYNSGILAEAVKIRDALTTNDFNLLKFSKHEDVLFEDNRDVVATWESLAQLDDKIIIAQTNAKVREYNGETRLRLDLVDEFPMKGERLLSIRNMRGHRQDGTCFQVYNGDFLRVIDVSSDPQFELEGFYRPKDSDDKYHFKYVFRKMSFSWVYEPERGEVRDVWVNVTPIVNKEWDSYGNYAEIGLYNGVKQYLEAKLRKKYSEYRKDRIRKTYWDELIQKALQDSVLLHAPIVKFGYAVTGHKSQGGEWDEVWADYSFGDNQHSADFFRWAYTVTTRAKKHLHVLCVPQLDTVDEVFSQSADCEMRQLEMSGQPSDNQNSPTIFARLETDGYSVTDVVESPFKYRFYLVHRDDGIPGWIDVMFKKNGIITAIDVRVDPSPDWIAEFKGHLVKEAIGDKSPSATDNLLDESDAGVGNIASARKRQVVERMDKALQRCEFKLQSVQELTPYQVRLNVVTKTGCGFIDLYFDGKECLTNRNTSLPKNDMNTIIRELNLGSESS